MFEPGNQLAKLKGKHKKTLEWEALGDAIVGKHADSFNKILEDYLKPDPETGEPTEAGKNKFTQNYLNVLNYFRPKHQSTVIEADIKDKRTEIANLFPEELKDKTDGKED